MNKNIKTIFEAREKLTIAHGVFEFRRQILTQLLSRYAEFKIDIIWQPGDGFTVLDVESGFHIIPLDICIKIIEEQKTLTRKEFLNYCI
jgi:hypothetical protein